MLIHIHNDLKVADIQERFSKCFPCLKIEFYKKPHRTKQPSKDTNLIDGEKRIGEIRNTHTAGDLVIKSWDTVEKVEKGFKENFGLYVQIFRKDINGWVQTSKTDKYTLLQQAEMVSYAHANVSAKFPDQLDEYEDL